MSQSLRERVCVCERKRCYVFVCVREKEREREREREKEREMCFMRKRGIVVKKLLHEQFSWMVFRLVRFIRLSF